MELKLSIIVIINVFRKVLIVPFMELKRIRINQTRDNRTFYGIETKNP